MSIENLSPLLGNKILEMVQCQEAPLHGKKIYGHLPAARHAPSKKVRYTSYYRFLRCAFLGVKKNYGKIRPDARQIFTDPCRTFFSFPKSCRWPYMYIHIKIIICMRARIYGCLWIHVYSYPNTMISQWISVSSINIAIYTSSTAQGGGGSFKIGNL